MKFIGKLLRVLIVVSILWTCLTLWVQYFGIRPNFTESKASNARKALILYNPDPIYNLDEQVCKSFAKGLAKQGFNVKVIPIDDDIAFEDEDLFVFCANTYNWAPDWKIKGFIQGKKGLKDQKVVAITLGSGSTQRAKRILEETILAQGAELLDSRQYWLMRPNDESRMDENNVDVAVDMAQQFGEEIGVKYKANGSTKE